MPICTCTCICPCACICMEGPVGVRRRQPACTRGCAHVHVHVHVYVWRCQPACTRGCAQRDVMDAVLVGRVRRHGAGGRQADARGDDSRTSGEGSDSQVAVGEGAKWRVAEHDHALICRLGHTQLGLHPSELVVAQGGDDPARGRRRLERVEHLRCMHACACMYVRACMYVCACMCT